MAFTSGKIAQLSGEIGESHDYQKLDSSRGIDLFAILDTHLGSFQNGSYFQGTVAVQNLANVKNVRIGEEELSTQNTALLRLGNHHGIDMLTSGEIEDSNYSGSPLKESSESQPEIQMTEEKQKTTDIYEIWGIDNEFLVFNGEDDKILGAISEMVDIETKPLKFNLDDIYGDYSDLWMGSFHGKRDDVESGTLYGDDVKRDPIIQRALKNREISQIGPKIPFDGDEVKCIIAENGSVQVVSPGNYSKKKFSEFIKNKLLIYSYVSS